MRMIREDRPGTQPAARDYETDLVLWSEHQAALLRRRAAGEVLNDAEFDWENLAAGIESVGSEQRFQLESLLLHALTAPHWRSEARVCLAGADSRFVPSMRQRVDLTRMYQKASRALPEAFDGRIVADGLMPRCQA